MIFLYLIRNFRYDDLFSFRPAYGNSFYDCLGTDSDAAPASGIHLLNTTRTDDNTGGREIGSRDVFHKDFRSGIWIRELMKQRVNYLSEIMRRYTGQVTNTYTCCAIDEQIR